MAAMLTYSANELLSLHHRHPPPRTMRKALFRLKLWRPRHLRRLSESISRRANCSRKLLRQLSIGWLNARSLANKAAAVHNAIVERKLDILVLTEVWHRSSEDICLSQATPMGYTYTEVARERDPGHGGIAVLHDGRLKCIRLELPSTATFEHLCMKFTTSNSTWLLLSIYRPGSCAPTMAFLDDLANTLGALVLHGCPVIIGGDLNVHIEDPADIITGRYIELLDSMDLQQHVTGPTHVSGGTLDHVITYSDFQVSNLSVDPPGIFSDHSLITCKIPVAHSSTMPTSRIVRSWKSVNRCELLQAIRDGPLGRLPVNDSTVDQLFSVYDDTLRDLANRFAPEHIVHSQVRPLCPWFDSECRAARRECRRLERRYRRTHLDADKESYIAACKTKHSIIEQRKSSYWTDRVMADSSSPKKLWRSLSTILEKDKRMSESTASTGKKADDFLHFFEDKVRNIRAGTVGPLKTNPLTPLPAEVAPRNTLSTLRPCSEAEVRRIITESPTKSCALDPIPTFLLKEVIDGLLPYVTAMINVSLKEGQLPQSQKHAIVTPILKKSGLDRDDLKNYRPVSNLTFISKVVERVVIGRVIEFIEGEGLMPRLQSAYRRHHSTETALLKVLSDILGAIDRKQVTLLGLLDLSAAFDCVDHEILLRRLQYKFGITGAALGWLSSFLTDRSQQVAYRGLLSETLHLPYGVPQGSVCGPVLFLLYVSDVFNIIAACGMSGHGYADDIQIYSSGNASGEQALMDQLSDCITRIRGWMAENCLKLNEDKTQIIWLGTRQQIQKITINALRRPDATIECATVVNNLGVLIDSQLTMANHVASVCRKSFFQLRQLRAVRNSLTPDATRMLAQAFISSRLDYCNSILYGISDHLIQKLQLVQNAAARLVFQRGKFDHITPVLRELHWLPVGQRVTFKLGTILFKAQHSSAPSYLTDMFCSTAKLPGRSHLRSALTSTLAVPRTRTGFGDRNLAVAGPVVWNSLPATLRSSDSTMTLLSFRKQLKTFLFD